MHVFRTFAVRGASSDAGLVRLLSDSRVLKAYPIKQTGEMVRQRWVSSLSGLLLVLVTVALGLHGALHSLVPLSHDEAALATFLAVLVILSWVSVTGLVSALVLLGVLWGMRFPFSSRRSSCIS